MLETLQHHLIALPLPLSEHSLQDHFLLKVTLLSDLYGSVELPEPDVFQRLLQHDFLLIDSLQPLYQRLREDPALIPLNQNLCPLLVSLRICMVFKIIERWLKAMRELIVAQLLIYLSGGDSLEFLLHPFDLAVTEHVVVLLHQLHEVAALQRVET